MLKIAVVGASGRMGQSILRLAKSMGNVAVVGALVRPGSPAEDKEVPDWPHICYTSDRGAGLAEAEVVLDFAAASDEIGLVRHCVDYGLPLLVGTTGLEASTRQVLEQAAKKIPVLIAPNTSKGVNILLELVHRAAAALDEDYDIEILEAHHGRKNDAPSGTALRLGEEAAEARHKRLDAVSVHHRKGQTGPRRGGDIGFSVVRGGDIAGEHTVYLAGPGERLELTHRASSRDTFAHGALDAARWLAGRRAGLYEMRDVLGF
ncbi:4-hydroxy-tetrahydrodipicolinate reductase [Natronospira proteinivora]|uniref:4-hydroxy-tetrahydrodipicolinate reductase n=1 Tax=Natronospira proteinivora TaxID=1807133 RepID=A0ABT1G6T5_9GAMM|nr:4-hydroxy-tetrahydrodipicolinate reductase [Natronospira proteinivora]MCP1726995.1 4-hydroxy-tetrahydrodipicolinate reductase [Natronospira proteinivora]